MEKHSLVLIVMLITFLFTLNAKAAIFGPDDRREVGLDPKMERLSRATALQVPLNFTTQDADGKWNVQFSPLSDPDTWNVCSDEPFAKQLASPIPCTGFLVGPDLLMTAGHCMVNWTKVENEVTPQCESFAWMFDYRLKKDGTVDTKSLDASKVLRCKKVIYANFEFAYDPATQKNTYLQDIALIQLEKPVTDREPMKISKTEPKMWERLTNIGYPMGVPAKFSRFAMVFDATRTDYFRTDMDALGGNSGSPALNAKDEVVGVIVRSFPSNDLVPDPVNKCMRANRCSFDRKSCSENDSVYAHGTEIQRASAILPYLPK